MKNLSNSLIILGIVIFIGCIQPSWVKFNQNQKAGYPKVSNQGTGLLFKYKSDIYVSRGTEKRYPKAFEIEVPHELKEYDFINFSEFALYFSQKQAILIITPLFEPIYEEKDTFYFPVKEELISFIEDDFDLVENKYFRKKNIILEGRKNAILSKDSTRIVLLNIQPQEFNKYLDFAKTFTSLTD